MPIGINFPVVPVAAGVPQLARSLTTFLPPAAEVLVQDALATFLHAPPLWGIFSGALPVLEADSILSVEFKRGWAIAEYPIEQGSFESYNKVPLPYIVDVVMTKGGTPLDRVDFLQQLDALATSLNLYTVTTPEYVFSNVNVAGISYMRTADHGPQLLTVCVTLQEVRVQDSGGLLSNFAIPSAAGPFNLGQLQSLQLPSVGSLASSAGSIASSVIGSFA